MTAINLISLILSGLQTLIVIAAPILVTRRYRRAPSRGLRFLVLGFWLILLAPLIQVIQTGLLYLLFHSGGFAARPIASVPFETIQVIVPIFEELLWAAGMVSLAYGALRIRTRPRLRFARARGPFAREIEELGIPSLRPQARFLRHWLLEDPNLEDGDRG